MMNFAGGSTGPQPAERAAKARLVPASKFHAAAAQAGAQEKYNRAGDDDCNAIPCKRPNIHDPLPPNSITGKILGARRHLNKPLLAVMLSQGAPHARLNLSRM